MLATPELIQTAMQTTRLAAQRPRWREFPIYQPTSNHEFLNLPLLGKADLRRNFPANFLPGERTLNELLDNKSIELEHTSGSSEERLAVMFPQGWWNEQEDRVLRLNPFVARVLNENPGARRASLVPPVCNGLVCFSNYTSKTARTVGSTLFVNQARIPFLLTEAELSRMAEEVLEWSPQFLDVDPVHGAWFALFCERNRVRFPSLKFILCSYEFVSVVHRRVLQRVFDVPVLNLYGSTETGHLLMENERGEMKASLHNAFLEVVSADDHGIGDLVVTTLTNDIMPLVRYRIGDLVECREHPYKTEYFVHGRIRDSLVRRDGRRVTTLDVDRCFHDIHGILHYQLRQNEHGSCDLKYVSDNEPPSVFGLQQMVDKITELFQLQNPLSVERVEKLPPLPSGKFRLTSRI